MLELVIVVLGGAVLYMKKLLDKCRDGGAK